MKKLSLFVALLLTSNLAFSQSKTLKKLPPKVAPKEAIQKATEVPVISPETAPPQDDSMIKSSTLLSADDKSMNFGLNPIVLVLGSLDAGLDFKVSDHWQVGPQLVLMNLKLFDIEFANQGGGVRVTWTPNNTAFSDGLFLQSGLGVTQVMAATTTSAGRFTAKANTLYYFFAGGYNWHWTNFNLKLGLGVSGSNLRNIAIYDSSSNLVDTGSIPVKTGAILEFGFAL